MAQMQEDNSNPAVQRLKRVAVIGCGSHGAQIAVRLSLSGNLVTVIDKESDSFSVLPSELIENSRVVISVGDGTKESSLRQAGVQDVDLFIAATGNPSVNLMSGQLARHIMRIPEVICLVDDSELISLYEGLAIKVINPDALLIDVIGVSVD